MDKTLTGKNPGLIMAIYGHPESYPPTLNAINELSNDYMIKVVHRAHQESNWSYPIQVELIPDGPVLTARQQEQLPTMRKVMLFLKFCKMFYNQVSKHQPSVVLMYDSLSILAYYLISKISFQNHPILWYHNHDVYDPAFIRKYSLSWWALKVEKKLFSRFAIFSLPAMDRQAFFPMQKLKGQFFFLPNYPAKKIYLPFFVHNKPLDDIRILYQGQLGEGHGIEELLEMMPFMVEGKQIKLVLRGHARNGYDKWLKTQIEAKKLEEHVLFYGFTPYKNIPALGAQCHIGLAVFKKQDVMNRTIGTASNKIYEYAALGLPTLYFDTPYFRAHLGKYSWAKGTDLSPNSIRTNLAAIIHEYTELSTAANQDFNTTLNFERCFSQVKDYLIRLQSEK